ncbi:cyanophycin metabolism-associated DUF1854 family protein [Verminephrobacter aporrectodeae]|uniref:DUF1854 domain-containing protein n=1 Tax=Verminephrobacter aporrectodeae subsp. tuberculatae TaxID=1110392 RepID=A0ABT3KUF3_9BURK|nr:DUF1854 domain-containing protein [Verminephrobacter aporrectodeae]MCW5222846.1 DUF1854 domain-containing protein [Verminephrobacter aporrectodeae subsp. tuberculatae]MCW5256937.1 DUF1854 domain-containing protein [Verminephrobacter aporrectodeae subsp. tuberculatae]MCW5288310.1 DUF1854 domain-containing protein [Verminephrobacter aporrectodeae subsp. tuberculatae]MCW5321851.1 DUF1854 domain-containing protein [Verminephrobacter aporrectodeae subsp. tuberculatae]MCW8163432.1 DUF1854 domain-
MNATPCPSPSPAFALTRNAHGRLVLTLPDGTAHEGVTPVRAFPIAAPAEGLALLGPDGHELLWIARLDRLADAVRQRIEEELAVREFAPGIEKILAVSSFSTPSTWDVETDRGPARLVLRAEEDIRRLDGRTHLLIASGDGVLFRIRDSTALERHSRRLLERFL